MKALHRLASRAAVSSSLMNEAAGVRPAILIAGLSWSAAKWHYYDKKPMLVLLMNTAQEFKANECWAWLDARGAPRDAYA